MRLLSSLFLVLMLSFSSFAQDGRKVLMIGIDGCRPDALQAANTPNMDNLIENGIYSPDALNDDITISGPGWSAILCGVWSPKHQVTDNDFSGDNYANYPSLFKYVEEYDSDLHTVSICHWAPINDFIVQDDADFSLNTDSDAEVASQAASYLAVNDPDLMFLHFDEIDYAGHADGFSPTVPAYLNAIENSDTHIGTVLQAIQQRPDYAEEDWLILVTTDHGGLGTSHGGNSLEEQNVFVIASGNSVPTTLIQKDSSTVYDGAVNCLGDQIELRFDGTDDYVQIPASSIYDFGANVDFTIECRVRTSESADVAIVGNKDWDSGNNKGFVFSFKYPSGPEWKVNIGDGTNRADINTGGLIADNEWYTLSVSFDRNGWMKMYQNGVLLDSADISAVGDINTNEGIYFGADINGAYPYSGAIAEVRVWDTVVEADAIADWYCMPFADTHPNSANLVGYWKLIDGFGSAEVVDASPTGANGNIQGAEWEDSDSIVLYDYSATPRLTDLPVTAMTYLCIPVEASWDLDGSSLIPECMTTSLGDLDNSDQLLKFKLFPNPTQDKVRLKRLHPGSTPVQVNIYQSAGTKVYEQLITTPELSLDLSAFPDGIYFIALSTEERESAYQKIVKSSH